MKEIKEILKNKINSLQLENNTLLANFNRLHKKLNNGSIKVSERNEMTLNMNRMMSISEIIKELNDQINNLED